MMFGFGLFDYIKVGAGLIIGASLTFYPARWLGQSEGKQMAATAALSKSVEILRDRNAIDDQVSTSDAAALCSDLGLSDDDKAECVRRILTPDSESEHFGPYPQDRQAVCQSGSKP